MLEEADTLKDMNLPKGTLVMIVKRGDEFLIPNGTLKLHEGDKLLLISEKSKLTSEKIDSITITDSSPRMKPLVPTRHSFLIHAWRRNVLNRPTN